MHPFCILMFIFSGAVLLYAGLLFLAKDYKLIPRGYATAPKDKKAYTKGTEKVSQRMAGFFM